jgi:AAA+ ATPase superfamily predicted ATPase
MAIASKTIVKKSFINRTEEMSMLNALYEKTKAEPQFFVLYGKRRVGKTELMRHFYKDKPHLYYLASKGSAKDQLRTLTEIIADYFHEPLGRDAFPDWRKLFDYLGLKLRERKERLVLVFDEFPYLAESDPAISSYFQYGWNEQLEKTNVFLVLMGSSIGMMYKHVLTRNAPLFGRRTGQLLLEPFVFKESKKFYHAGDFEKLFSFYAIVGGMPAYLREFDERNSLVENIREKILTRATFLNLEPELLLSEDFNEPAKYLTILKAIGIGQTRYAELLNVTGLANNELPVYLKNLIDLRLIQKEVPVTEPIPEKSKKGSYSLSDNFLRFYFSYIFPNASLVEEKEYATLFNKNKNLLIQLIAKSYEETTSEFIKTAMKKRRLPHFNKLGRWWDKNTEIDLVGLNEETNSILFVETKWNNKPIGMDILHSLKQKASHVQWGSNERKEYFALVARGGFTEALKKQAQQEEILLIEKDIV